MDKEEERDPYSAGLSMPPVGDDPVPRSARPAAAPIISSSAAFATSARAPSSPRWRRRPAAAAPPRRPEPVAPLTDAAIAAAPNRISLKWNRRRRPGAGPSGSRCRPRARESMDKEEERDPYSAGLSMPPVGDDPVPRSARPAAAPIISSSAAFATSARAPSSPRWRRRPAAAAPPRRPEPVAPLTDAAIAAAPNRISLKWNRRRRPGGGPSGSRCRPRARESSDKEEERANDTTTATFMEDHGPLWSARRNEIMGRIIAMRTEAIWALARAIA